MALSKVIAKSGGGKLHLSKTSGGASLCGSLVQAASQKAGGPALKRDLCAACAKAAGQ